VSDIINLDEVTPQPGDPTVTFTLALDDAGPLTLPLWGSVEVDGGWLSFVPPSFGPMKIIGARTVGVDEFASEMGAEYIDLSEDERLASNLWDGMRIAEEIDRLIAMRAHLKAGIADTERHELPAGGSPKLVHEIYLDHPLAIALEARITELRAQLVQLI
jgi:hypothetical protein